MPRLSAAYPKYRKHRASGQAVVTLCGKDFYLGPYGTKTSHREYDRLIAEWLANGRRLAIPADKEHLSLLEVMAAYKSHAEGYYVKNGKITNEVCQILSAMSMVGRLYEELTAADFGPLKLQAVQQVMIAEGWSRKHINKQIGRIVRMMSWAAFKELCPANIPVALREVPSLHKGRTKARESEPVLPVAEDIVQQTLHHLSEIVADMVRFQRLTGARPEEVCMIRPGDIDTNDEVWKFIPESHKTEHQDRQRVIFIGPRAQEVLRPYLLRGAESCCFSPAEAERQQRAERHEARKTPINYGNRPGTNRNPNAVHGPGHRYTTASYRRAIHRACELAFNMPAELRKKPREETAEAKQERLKAAAAWRGQHCWSPNQLRHSAATEIRKRYGLEAAQVCLGHASADVSQVYAERDLAKAASVMREVG